MKPVQLDEGNVNGATKERSQGGYLEFGARPVDVRWPVPGRAIDDARTRELEHAGVGRLPRESWIVDRDAAGADADRDAAQLDVVDVSAGPHITVLQDREKAGSWTSLTLKSDLT